MTDERRLYLTRAAGQFIMDKFDLETQIELHERIKDALVEFTDWATAQDRQAMQAMMQVLGPEAIRCKQGCDIEINKALDLLESVGIHYINHRARRHERGE